MSSLDRPHQSGVGQPVDRACYEAITEIPLRQDESHNSDGTNKEEYHSERSEWLPMTGAENSRSPAILVYNTGQVLILLALLIIVLSVATGRWGCTNTLAGCMFTSWHQYLFAYPGITLFLIGLFMSFVGFISR